ncbi:Rhodanese-like domain containing protein [Tritrichomonas foetus]|uniref:protein-tyrosine-phosphatase n=1 Tax=Tritrichomonas foetus TaxID=1144522 RepID=A0A1J4JMQ6_9EUKA|nr:Rhodanese-like domain containing protein [Tritrichomonas foetus]|eukprot:OHS98524.1 Rhodanese-like domain containing protein [Tritrichomonas foetus]
MLEALGDPEIPVPDLDDCFFSPEVLVETKELKLPHLTMDNVPRITCQQLAELISDPMSHNYDSMVILDARFHYEYRGGHIKSAKNITSQASLKSVFDTYANQNVCIVCHCEYSHNRGPSLYNSLRQLDRDINTYPYISIPEMYVLNGGYRQFFSLYPNLCVGGYIEMRDEEHVLNGDLRRFNSSYRKEMRRPAIGLMKRSNSTVICDPQTFALPQPLDPMKFSYLSFSSSQEPSF